MSKQIVLNNLKKKYGMFINGKESFGQNQDKIIQVLNPYNIEIQTEVYSSSKQDVDQAVQNSYETFKSGIWSQMDVREKSKILINCSNVLKENINKFAQMESVQIGRPIKEMNAQLGRLPEWFEYFASLIRVQNVLLSGYTTPFKGDFINYVQKVPLGVCGQIVPWNHPLLITVKKLAPALAAGNSVIIKPSELAPCSVLELAQLLTDRAGLPKGVLNIVTGYGKDAGQTLCQNPLLRKIDFTGGTDTGRLIGSMAGKNITSVLSELGGKSPMIVFQDVDIDEAVNACVFGTFIAAGQTCIAGTRYIVHESIYEEFKQKIINKVSNIRLGDPQQIETQMGPVISQNQLDKIITMVEKAIKQGAKILTGGQRSQLFKGYFYEPTVIEVTPDMSIVQEEVFGPVVVLYKFKDEQQAVRLANDSKYGLAVSIWTNNIKLAHRVANQMEAGIIWINDHHKNDPSSPWGGFKDSGIGRENGIEALNAYQQSRSVIVNYGNDKIDWFSNNNQNKRYS